MKLFFPTIFLVIVVIIVFLVLFLVTKKEQSDKYLPFAALPEIQLSESSFNTVNKLVHKITHTPTTEEDIPMLSGNYKRYPLNRKMQKTSIVAVNAGLDNNLLSAWHLQVGINGMNLLWPDRTSSYWVSLINVKESPVVVLKGQFPYARYFSIYSYVGIDKDSINEAGTGVTKFDSKNEPITNCNPTQHNCAGLHDVDIAPDEGSKNPFTDKTFDPNVDSSYYTIYFVSPFYKGQLPKSNNIFLPMSTATSEQCMICLRIYAPFNPKFCGSTFYSSLRGFTTEGCKTEEPVKTFLPGGAVSPKVNNMSPCSPTDTACVQAGINFQVGKDFNKDCYKYAGNNKYCVCEGDNPISECGQYLDAAIKKYSNNKGSLRDYCKNAPPMEPGVSYCIDDIVLKDGSLGKNVTLDTKCPKDDNACNYVSKGRLQQCVSKKLFQSKNPACAPFKNPQTLTTIGDEPNDCQIDFVKYILKCMKSPIDVKTLNPQQIQNIINAYVSNQPPPYNYKPDYDFETCPEDCDSKCGTYTCQNGYCIPKIGGEYKSADCNGQCETGCETEAPQAFKCSKTKLDNASFCVPCKQDDTDCQYSDETCDGKCKQIQNYSCLDTPSGKQCIVSTTGKYKNLRQCMKKCGATKEGFENPICNSVIGPQNCNPDDQMYTNIVNFYANAPDSALLFDSGWVGLPDIFLKYSFNDYFIRMNNYKNSSNYKATLMSDVKGLKKSLDYQNYNNPEDPILVKSENPNINIKDYANSLDIKENFESSRRNKKENMCPTYVDPQTYFTIGTQYAAPKITNMNITKTVPPPGCSYYKDICDCESHRKNSGKMSLPSKIPPQCGLKSVLKIDGSSCFNKWSLTLPTICSMKAKENCKSNKKYKFAGKANPFFISPNVSDVIKFPNPDTDYMGAFTEYNDKYVYVIWMDIPSTPITPGFKNIIKNDYQTRYWSIGHYGYGFSLTSPRPVLSSLMDFEVKTKPVHYKDQKTHKKVSGNRVCVVVASTEQYNYLKTYKLWNEDNLSWLNWGASSSKLLSTWQKLKKKRNAAHQDMETYLQTDFESSDEEVDMLSQISQKHELPELSMASQKKYGILLYRQMLPSFSKSISNYVDTVPSCLNKQIPLEDEKYLFTPNEKGIKAPVYISKSCNPGPSMCRTDDGKEQQCSEKYNLDPCCVATEPLDFMQEYYPRCERVKICDIEQLGSEYWERYLEHPLPYDYE